MYHDTLHHALKAVIRGQTSRSGSPAWAAEYQFVQTLCARIRKLQYNGVNRAAIAAILIAEMADDSAAEPPGAATPPQEDTPHPSVCEERPILRLDCYLPAGEAEPEPDLWKRFIQLLRRRLTG